MLKEQNCGHEGRRQVCILSTFFKKSQVDFWMLQVRERLGMTPGFLALGAEGMDPSSTWM